MGEPGGRGPGVGEAVLALAPDEEKQELALLDAQALALPLARVQERPQVPMFVHALDDFVGVEGHPAVDVFFSAALHEERPEVPVF